MATLFLLLNSARQEERAMQRYMEGLRVGYAAESAWGRIQVDPLIKLPHQEEILSITTRVAKEADTTWVITARGRWGVFRKWVVKEGGS